MSRATYAHKFVKTFPDRLEEGTLYVSVEFGTSAHSCFCGCGSEVYTRFSPRDWSMKFDGETVSISPSIGNWSFACESHYILANGRVRWADKWSRDRIELGRSIDRDHKERHLSDVRDSDTPLNSGQPPAPTPRVGLMARMARWLSGS